MSQENVETVRAVFEVWNAEDMRTLHELYDPEVIVRPPEGWPEPGSFRGSGGGHAPVEATPPDVECRRG
jgi:ketosteroid isomerase-like protein